MSGNTQPENDPENEYYARSFTLDDLARSAHALKNGEGHGPYDPMYRLLGLAVGFLAVVMAWNYGQEWISAWATWPLSVVPFVVVAFFGAWGITEVLTFGLRRRHHSWAQSIDQDLADYRPLNQAAYSNLQAQAKAAGGITFSQLITWLKLEREALQKLQPTTPTELFIGLPATVDKAQ